MTDDELDVRSHRADRPYALALAFTALMVVTLVGLCLFFLNSGKQEAERRLERSEETVSGLQMQLDADRAKTDCIRSLSVALNDADVNNSLAFNRYVIGLGQRGDIAALQADLDAAGLALQGARDAYVAQDCPAG